MAPIVVFVGRVGQAVLQIASIRLLTALLPGSEVGRYYLLLSIQGWISNIFVNPPAVYLCRNFLSWKVIRAHGVAMTAYLVYLLLIGVGCFPIVVAVLEFGLLDGAQRNFITASLVVGFTLVSGAVSTCASLLNLLERRVAFVLVMLLSSAAGIGMAASLVWWQGKGTAEAWISGLLGGQLLLAAPAAFFLARISGANFVPVGGAAVQQVIARQLGRAWSFMWPVGTATLLYWFYSQGYRFGLVLATSEEAVGLFGVAYSIGATVIVTLESVLNQWLQPIFYRKSLGLPQSGIDGVWQELVALQVRILMPVGTFAVFAGPFLVRLLVGEGFQVAAPYAMWGGAAESIRLVSGFFYVGALGRQRTRSIIAPHVPGAVLAVAGSFVLSRVWYLHGAGISLACAYLVLAFLMWRSVQRNLFARVRLGDLKPALVSCVGLVALFGGAGAAGWRDDLVLSGAVVVIAIGWLLFSLSAEVRRIHSATCTWRARG